MLPGLESDGHGGYAASTSGAVRHRKVRTTDTLSITDASAESTTLAFENADAAYSWRKTAREGWHVMTALARLLSKSQMRPCS